ncbi:hypothetical protein [Roseicella sp. DB1501]|uniref:hypothetical protein n=1 Tax=Roseicella sp. DB1501 TaxID=2730925 RepID=UPI00149257B0|nr:hypothetical protein [Roseicella sp. DB1501]NOG72621.1 hypothetical protein [Roseicella sp. DB1501]
MQTPPSSEFGTYDLATFRRLARPAQRRNLKLLFHELLFHVFGGIGLLGLGLLAYLMLRALGAGGLPDGELEQAVAFLLAL